MGTLIDVSEYFEDDKLPHGHPWQEGKQSTAADNDNPNLKRKDSEEQFGYKKDKTINNSESYDKLKKK